MDKKRVLIYFPHDATHAPRVLAEIEALKKNYHVMLMAYKFDNSVYRDQVEFIEIPKFDKPKSRVLFHLNKLYHLDFLIPKDERLYWSWYFRRHRDLALTLDFDILISHNTRGLITGCKIADKKGVPHIFNAHEYYPRQFECYEKWVRNIQPYELAICKKYLSKVDHIFCIGNRIKAEYQRNFDCAEFTFVPNDKPFHELSPALANGPLKMIYQGGCKRARRIEEVLEVMMKVDPNRYTMDLMLMVYDHEYLEELKEMVKDHNHINFIDAVPIHEIIPKCNAYDIGYFSAHGTFNLENCLPNKFFEYIQARLCLITTPNPEMKDLIEEFELGFTSETYEPDSMVDLLNRLSPKEIENAKNNSHTHARQLSSGKTYKNMLAVVDHLTQK